jgi:hypothetical protein
MAGRAINIAGVSRPIQEDLCKKSYLRHAISLIKLNYTWSIRRNQHIWHQHEGNSFFGSRNSWQRSNKSRSMPDRLATKKQIQILHHETVVFQLRQ